MVDNSAEVRAVYGAAFEVPEAPVGPFKMRMGPRDPHEPRRVTYTVEYEGQEIGRLVRIKRRAPWQVYALTGEHLEDCPPSFMTGTGLSVAFLVLLDHHKRRT